METGGGKDPIGWIIMKATGQPRLLAFFLSIEGNKFRHRFTVFGDHQALMRLSHLIKESQALRFECTGLYGSS
jgi:hypothetical protein